MKRTIVLFSETLLLLFSITFATGAEPFRFEKRNDRSLAVYEGNKPVLVYNHGLITNAALPKAQPHSAYIHPLYGLDGEILTGDFPADHIYHRGIYWAWPHIKVGDKEVDLWSLRGIRQEFERWTAREANDSHALLALENSWMIEDKKIMGEKVRIRVHRADENDRAIDVEISWTPTDAPVTLRGAPGKSYGGFNFRFGNRSKTIITIPTGRTQDDLLMTRLPWVDFSGDMDANAQGRLSGAAVFVHPENPDFPPEWMTRHYGLLAAGWPGVKPQTIASGKTITSKYRIWVHRNVPEAAEIQKAYETIREAAAP